MPVVEHAQSGRPLQKIQFRFTINERQLASMTPDEVMARIQEMGLRHVKRAHTIASEKHS